MDPQQRIMLELVYQSILDSNIPLNDITGSKTGVFVGSCNTEYFSNESENSVFCNEYSITGGLLTLLDAFTGVFDKTHPLINKINDDFVYSDREKKSLAELVARYTLGYQIEYCLRTTDSCNINCEY